MKILSIPLLLALGCAGAVQAETFAVTRLDDPEPDACVAGDCSLREAAMAADANNAFGPTDVIALAAGTYHLIRGELTVNQNLIVQGAGSLLTHVETGSILFQGHDLLLDLRALSMQTTNTFVVQLGDNGTLLLDDVATPADGGIVEVFADTSDLEIRNSDLRDGVICVQTSGACSIIDSQLPSLFVNPAMAPGPAVLLSGSVLDGALNPTNPATDMAVYGASSVHIEDSMITHTRYGLRDVTTSLPMVRLLRVNFVDNAAPVRFSHSTDVEIIDSVFDSNPTRAIYAENESTWTISGSSFVNNSVDGNAGGAIVVEDSASVHMENSTFSGNTFSAAAAQAGARGAAIGYRNGSGAHLDLHHVTIKPPSFGPVGVQGIGIAGYGGAGAVVVDISNSILVGSGSCYFDAGTLNSAVGNIESPAHSCGFSSSTNQIDVSTANLALGSLGDHGGPTPTYEPSVASVAVNAANQALCLALDQRGYLRPHPLGGNCDVGAVEVGSISDTIFANGFE